MLKYYNKVWLLFILLLPLAVLGFYDTYFRFFPFFNSETINIFHHIHVMLGLTWIGLLILQPLLIRLKKTAYHKKIGRASQWLFAIIILSFIPLMVIQAEKRSVISLVYPIGNMVLLSTFYLLGLKNKRQVNPHILYMVLSALVLLEPITVRVLLSLGKSGILTINSAYLFDFLANLPLYFVIGLLFIINYQKRFTVQPLTVGFIALIIFQLFEMLAVTAS